MKMKTENIKYRTQYKDLIVNLSLFLKLVWFIKSVLLMELL